MLIDLLRYLLSLVGERCGALVSFARQALDAIRSLLGRGRALVGSLVGKIVSLVKAALRAPVSPSGHRAVNAALKRIGEQAETILKEQDAAETSAAPKPETAAPQAPGATPEKSAHETTGAGAESVAATPTPDAATTGAAAGAPASPAHVQAGLAYRGGTRTWFNVLAPIGARMALRALTRRRPRRPAQLGEKRAAVEKAA